MGLATQEQQSRLVQRGQGHRKASTLPAAPFLQRPLEGERAGLEGTEFPDLSRGNKERKILNWREGAYGGFWQGRYEVIGPQRPRKDTT